MKSNIDYYQIKENRIFLRINTSVYSFEVIISTLYPYLEDNYIILDGDRNSTVNVEIKPKRKIDLDEFANEIFNRLFLYNIHEMSQNKNRDIIDNIMKNTLNKFNKK